MSATLPGRGSVEGQQKDSPTQRDKTADVSAATKRTRAAVDDSIDLKQCFNALKSERLEEIRKEFLPVLPSLADLSSYANTLIDLGKSLWPSFSTGADPGKTQGEQKKNEQSANHLQDAVAASSPLGAMGVAVSNVAAALTKEGSVDWVEIKKALNIYNDGMKHLGDDPEKLKQVHSTFGRHAEQVDKLMRQVTELASVHEHCQEQHRRRIHQAPEFHAHPGRTEAACKILDDERCCFDEEHKKIIERFKHYQEAFASGKLTAREQLQMLTELEELTTEFMDKSTQDSIAAFRSIVEIAGPGFEKTETYSQMLADQESAVEAMQDIRAEVQQMFDEWIEAVERHLERKDESPAYEPPSYAIKERSYGLFDGPPGPSLYSSLKQEDPWISSPDARQAFTEQFVPEVIQTGGGTPLKEKVIENPINISADGIERLKQLAESSRDLQKLQKLGIEATTGLDGKLSRHDQMLADMAEVLAGSRRKV